MAVALLLPLMVWGQAQIDTKKMKISDFTEKITKVVLTGNQFHDALPLLRFFNNTKSIRQTGGIYKRKVVFLWRNIKNLPQRNKLPFIALFFRRAGASLRPTISSTNGNLTFLKLGFTGDKLHDKIVANATNI